MQQVKITDAKAVDLYGTEGRLAFLDSYRGLGIALVIALHSLAFTEVSDHYRHIITLATSIAVPIFFLTDGYLLMLLSTGRRGFSYREYIAKSTRRLVWPWAIFSCGYAVMRLMAELSGYLENHKILGHQGTELLWGFYFSSFAGHLYFLLSLYFVRIAAGPLYVLSAMAPWLSLGIFLAYSSAYSIVNPAAWFGNVDGNDPILHFLWGMQYFLLGIALFRYIPRIREWAAFVSFLCVSLFITGQFIVFSPRLAQYGYLVGMFLVFLALPRLAGLHLVGKHTMGMYLLHYPLILTFSDILLTRIFRGESLAFFFGLTFFTAALSLFLSQRVTLLPYGNYLFALPKKSDTR